MKSGNDNWTENISDWACALSSNKYMDEVQEKFVQKFHEVKVPYHAVWTLLSKFHETDSILDAPDLVTHMFQRIQCLTYRTGFCIVCCTLHKFLKRNLKMYPSSVVHQMQLANYETPVHNCKRFQTFLRKKVRIYLMSLSQRWGMVCRIQATVRTLVHRIVKIPHNFKEICLHDQKVKVWCAIDQTSIIGPTFFTNIINAERYHTCISELFTLLNKCKMVEAWFQQAGAMAHTTYVSLTYQKEFFPDHVISCGIWPAFPVISSPQ